MCIEVIVCYISVIFEDEVYYHAIDKMYANTLKTSEGSELYLLNNNRNVK